MSVFEHPITSGLFGDLEAQAPWSAEQQLSHYIAFETALAESLEQHGFVEAGEGSAAIKTLAAFQVDMDALVNDMSQDGVPIPNLVKQMRAAAGGAHKAVHTGATSQDVMDTALSLTLKSVTDIVLNRLQDVTGSLSQIIETYGQNPMTGRTRMQAALPITVADRFDVYLSALTEDTSRLSSDRSKVERLQLGGPVGTNKAFGDDAESVSQHMASHLGLTVAPGVWHADRTQIVSFANQLSLITGTLGKLGQDVALMAQQGVDEITLASGGTSSAMPHKSNPVGAELLVTLARYNAGQIGLLHNAMIHEQERSGAAWMLEWMVLPQICTTTCLALKTATTLCTSIKKLGKQ
ncbi:MAG: 3-carboxy-cis,cis-muconate cycloisomerase [Cognatishimia sp.]